MTAAAFGYLSVDDPRPSVRLLLRALRLPVVRSLLISAVALALIGVLLIDIKILAEALPGAALVPLLALLLLLVVTASLTALMLTATNPELSHGGLLRVAIYATVRSLPLSLLSLAVLAAAALIVSQAPLAGLATVRGCALSVAFINTKLQLSRLR